MMSIRLPHEYYYNLALTGEYAFLPFSSASSAPLDFEFTGFGFTGLPGAAGVGFFPGWRLRTPLSSDFASLKAMFTGSLYLKEITGSSPYFQLILSLNDPVVIRAFKHLRPEWMPLPRIIIYENVDVNEVRRALLEFSVADPNLIRTNIEYLNTTLENRRYDEWEWESVVADFLNISSRSPALSEFPITVKAGLVIGRSASSPVDSTKAESRIFIKTILSNTEELEGDIFVNPSFYVSRWLELFADGENHPLINEMIRVNWSILTNLSFRFVRSTGGFSGSSELFLDPNRPASTVSAAIERARPFDTVVILDNARYREPQITINKPIMLTSIIDIDVLSDNTTPTIFPQLDGNNSHRVIQINHTDVEGVVCLRNLTIQAGQVTDTDSINNGHLGGAGILVHEKDDVLIENCYIHNNQTFAGSLPQINVERALDRISDPLKKSAVRLAMMESESEEDLTAIPNYGLLAHGYGGGISLTSSSAYIYRNYITNNRSSGRGAGVGAAIYSWPVIELNRIVNNSATQPNGRGDGGGIACTASGPNKMGADLRTSVLLDQLIEFINNIGYPELSVLLTSGGLYAAMKEFIRQKRRQWFYENKLREAKQKFVCIRGNRILDNQSRDDGGGIYLSIQSQAYLENNEISGNAAHRGGGGGIRATMASNLTLNDNRIFNNQSNSNRVPVDQGGNGGGGVACRNVELEIKGATQIHRNIANGWAGGGLFFTASDEGGFILRSLRLYHVILVDIFNFRSCLVRVREQARLIDNSTTQVSGQSNHGKGGGVYFLRYREVDIPSLNIQIDTYHNVVSRNHASSANSDNFTLLDQAAALPEINDIQVNNYLVGSELRYP